MDWYSLKSNCIDSVARELARPLVAAEVAKSGTPSLLVWAELQSERGRQDEAVHMINNMRNIELLDLIGEVVGREA